MNNAGPKVLLLDNYDSFTWNLVHYLQQASAQVQVFRNQTPLEELLAQDWQGIVLSPGPGVPATSGVLMPLIEATFGQIPLLGVCLGHQALGEYMGASLVKAQAPVHGKLSPIRWSQPDVLWQGLPPEIEVVRYHSWVLAACPPGAVDLAWSLQENELMAFRHAEYPVWGVQFHPEAIGTCQGLDLVANWVQTLANDK